MFFGCLIGDLARLRGSDRENGRERDANSNFLMELAILVFGELGDFEVVLRVILG